MTSTVTFDVPESVHGTPCGTFLDIGFGELRGSEFVGVFQDCTSGHIMLAYCRDTLPITSVTVRRPGSPAVAVECDHKGRNGGVDGRYVLTPRSPSDPVPSLLPLLGNDDAIFLTVEVSWTTLGEYRTHQRDVGVVTLVGITADTDMGRRVEFAFYREVRTCFRGRVPRARVTEGDDEYDAASSPDEDDDYAWLAIRAGGTTVCSAVRRDSVVAGALFDVTLQMQAGWPSATLDASLLVTDTPVTADEVRSFTWLCHGVQHTIGTKGAFCDRMEMLSTWSGVNFRWP